MEGLLSELITVEPFDCVHVYFHKRTGIRKVLEELSIYNRPTNALVCNKTVIQMHTLKHLKSLQYVSIVR
jgi:hypothetical protein